MCLAVPGQVVSISGADPLDRVARVDFAGVIRAVSAACVPDAAPGDYVLVHAGLAISTIDAEEAARTLSAIAALEDPDANPWR